MPVLQPQSKSASSATEKPLALSEVISALSFAIDLTEGAVPGHALRTCVLGMRLGQRLGLSSALLGDLYYALLLKDIGCSSNAARVGQIVGGDDRVLKAGLKLEDWTDPHSFSRSSLHLLWNNVLPHAHPLQRIGRIANMALHTDENNMEIVALRCERGAEILEKLGFSPTVATAVRSLDEHWDGRGYPRRLVDSSIPILARIVAVAQHLDVFSTARSPVIALDVLRERSGHWFDPALVQTTLDLDRKGLLWLGCSSANNHDETLRLVLDLAPHAPQPLAHSEIDRLCEGFAEVVDAKSPFTYRHSLGVAEVAVSIATALGLPIERCQLVRRAALLHDLGKLSLPNTILDNPGKLSPEERHQVEQHPRHTAEILSRIEPFREIAAIAGAHHEKLDGSGYPHHLTAPDIPLEARILAVADIYRALTEDRPYRAGLTHAEVMTLLHSETPHRLDPQVVAALDSAQPDLNPPPPSVSSAPKRRSPAKRSRTSATPAL